MTRRKGHQGKNNRILRVKYHKANPHPRRGATYREQIRIAGQRLMVFVTFRDSLGLDLDGQGSVQIVEVV